MKKLLLIGLMAVSCSAMAEKWVTIAKGVDGTTLDVNADSFSSSEVKGTPKWVGAFFRIQDSKISSTVSLMYTVPLTSCKVNSGAIKIVDLAKGVDEQRDSTWVKGGNHYPDNAGEAICWAVDNHRVYGVK